MLTANQHDRIARKCAAALSAVIDALPQLVADSDPDTAAMIAADLVKACLVGPTPEVDPGAALAEVIRRCAEMESAEPAQPAPDYASAEVPNHQTSGPSNLPTFEHSNLPTGYEA